MAEEYKGIKLPALRKIAEEKGLDGYEDLEREALLEVLIALDLNETDPDPEPIVKEEDTKEEVSEIKEEEEEETGAGVTGERTPVGSKAAEMKKRLALQDKITIMIPLEGKEKKGSTFPVTLNGYRVNIQKGVYVPVPKQVAEIVMESQKQTVAAADELKRVDGTPVKIDGETPTELE